MEPSQRAGSERRSDRLDSQSSQGFFIYLDAQPRGIVDVEQRSLELRASPDRVREEQLRRQAVGDAHVAQGLGDMSGGGDPDRAVERAWRRASSVA